MQEKQASTQPVTAVIVGAGHRSLCYAKYAEIEPDRLRIVGVVEPDPERQRLTAERFSIPPTHCFDSVEQLAAAGRIADAAINGTMDQLHVATTLPLLEAGYDVLLEKPIATSDEDLTLLQQAAHRYGRRVRICHVLRYAPFYRQIKEQLAAGAIGEVTNIQTNEHVSYHHMAVSYIRGKWGSQEACGSSMLMAKCSHDLDLLTWLVNEQPLRVSSFGSLKQFRPDRAPEGAGTRCMTDCQIEEQCAYSARKQYLEQNRWGFYVWGNTHLGVQPTEEEKREELMTTNPYGRCVWRCDNDVVDHQSVLVEFANEATATHNMIGATARPQRTIHIVGTTGEISGVLEDGTFVIRKPDLQQRKGYSEEQFRVDVTGDSHGGGDLLLVNDFVRTLLGETPSISCTSLDASVHGHRIGFAAERSRLAGTVEQL